MELMVHVLEQCLTPSRAARELGVSSELVRLWMRNGRLNFIQTPLGRLIPREELEKLARERKQLSK